MNMDLKQKNISKHDISAEEKTKRERVRGEPSEYNLALPHNRFLDCERTCAKGICTLQEPTVRPIYTGKTQPSVLKLT